jgi:DNA-binding protein H-NS
MTFNLEKKKMQGSSMSTKKLDLEAMSVDDLWSLHEKISTVLSARITSEKRELENRLAILNRGRDVIEGGDALQPYHYNDKARRKYPRVVPKYRNPQTSETWSGRGKQPRWLTAAIKTGRKIEDFMIDEAGVSSRPQRA